jgi:hypothetical protein
LFALTIESPLEVEGTGSMGHEGSGPSNHREHKERAVAVDSSNFSPKETPRSAFVLWSRVDKFLDLVQEVLDGPIKLVP